MTEEIAGKIVEAYKTSPLLTGLLLLNVGLAIGFGWGEYKRVNAVDAFVQKQLAKQEALQERLMAEAPRQRSLFGGMQLDTRATDQAGRSKKFPNPYQWVAFECGIRD